MTVQKPRTRQFRARVRAAFQRQTALRQLDAALGRINPGEVTIDLRLDGGSTPSGIVTALLGCAAELAAVSMARAGALIVPVEHKVNFTTPELEGPLQACGSVVRSGGSITVCRGTVISSDGGRPVAYMLATFITEAPRSVRYNRRRAHPGS